jgi:hypothetical protein
MEEEEKKKKKTKKKKTKKAWVCGHSHAKIVGSNPAGGMDVCLL